MFELNKIKIKWLGHDGFLIDNGTKIFIDPYQINTQEKADILLLSHNHFDHLNIDDIKKIATSNTVIVAAKECLSMITAVNCEEKFGIVPSETITVQGITITGTHAYNTNKINPDTKRPFHPKEDNKLGFLIHVNDITIYHTGDSDLIPGMHDTKPDVLLVPVSGTYVMTPKEAARAVEEIKPRFAIPMHYGTIVGSEKDAHDFKQLVSSCEVQILTKE